MSTKAAERKAIHGTGKRYWQKLRADLLRDKWLFLLLLPGLIYFVIFKYLPMFGIVIVVSITFVMFGSSGIVFKLTEMLLGHPINYMGSPDTFRWMIIGQPRALPLSIAW